MIEQPLKQLQIDKKESDRLHTMSSILLKVLRMISQKEIVK